MSRLKYQFSEKVKLYAILIFMLLQADRLFSQVPDHQELSIENDNDFSSFTMLDEAVKNYKVFFTGENHLFRKSNYMLQLKMLKYLYKTAGVRHLFIEFGYSRGWLINQYVQTGDTSLFNIISNYSYDEYALLYKGIYEFNQTLDSSKRIMVSGIDMERSVASAIKVLGMYLPETAAPKSIELNVDALRALEVMNDQRQDSRYDSEYNTGYSPYNSLASLRNIMDDYDSNNAVYREYLGANAENFDRVVSGLKAELKRQHFQATGAVQQYILREEFMYDRLTELIHEYPEDKFYSQFGRCHTPVEFDDYWCGYYFYRTLSTRISESKDSLLHHKVMSIACYYPEAYGGDQGITGVKKLTELLPYTEKEKLTLFKVTEDTSLFSEFQGKFQYLIINRNLPGKDRASLDGGEDVVDANDDNEYQERITFSARYSLRGNKLSGLRNQLAAPFDSSASAFKDQSYWVGGEMSYAINSESFFNMYYEQRIPTTVASGNTSLKLDGYVFGVRSGQELSVAKWFCFAPYAGLSFGRLRLQQQTSGVILNNGVFTQNAPVSSWKNPFLLYEMGVDLKLQWWIFSLGISGGGQVDLTNRKWRSSGSLDVNSPKTSFTGYYVTATLGLSFVTF